MSVDPLTTYVGVAPIRQSGPFNRVASVRHHTVSKMNLGGRVISSWTFEEQLADDGLASHSWRRPEKEVTVVQVRFLSRHLFILTKLTVYPAVIKLWVERTVGAARVEPRVPFESVKTLVRQPKQCKSNMVIERNLSLKGTRSRAD